MGQTLTLTLTLALILTLPAHHAAWVLSHSNKARALLMSYALTAPVKVVCGTVNRQCVKDVHQGIRMAPNPGLA